MEALGSTRTQDLTPPLTVRRPPPFVPVRSRAHSARERGSGRPVVDNGARRAPFAHEKRNSNFSTARTPDALAHTSKTHQSPLTQADEQDPTKRRTLRLPPGPEKNGSTIERYVTASPTFADDTLRPAQLGSIYAGIFIPVCVIIAIYSAMGEGIEVYSNLSREGNYAIAWYLCVAAIGWLAAMWVVDAFDKSITSPAAKRAVKICTVIPLGMIFIASLLAVEEYVSAPMVLFVIFKALIDKTMYDFVCPYLRIGVFMTAVGQGNFVASACVIFGWCVWMWAFDKEWNNKEMFDLYHQRLDCDRATDSLEVGRCQAAYLLWGAPLVVGLLCFFFGLACLYLAREGSAVRMLMVQFLIVGMGMWVSMSISGAEMGLADDILQFVLLFCSLMIVVCINMIGYDKVKAKIGNMRIASKIGEYSQSNFAKAMLIVISLPLFPFFLALSMMIRQSRRVGLSLAPQKRELDDEHKYFTAAAWGMLKWLFSDITSVMTWCAYIAIFYFICDVGVGKGATLFLGWMISVMKDLSPSVVLFCFILLGVSMFLLPPVPGPPVYLTGGVLLVGSMEEQLGFWGAAFLCVFVCWFTKLLSCAMQQKLFGENLSNYVSVRYAVGINSLQMRAIRYCLMQPGLSPAKVAILCGGPDWPTSVLCGILRVPLHEALIGTSPVLVLYLCYTVLAGAFTLKTGGDCAESGSSGAFPPPPPFPPPAPGAAASVGETNYWQMASAVALGVAMISMSCTSFAAVYFMEDTIANKRAECDAFPVDEEVEARELKVQAKQVAYKHVTRWQNLPPVDRWLLGGSVLLMCSACHLAGNFGPYCFSTFTVTCTVALVDVVLPLGWVAIALFCSGLFLFQFYQKGASARTKKVMESSSAKDMPAKELPDATHQAAETHD